MNLTELSNRMTAAFEQVAYVNSVLTGDVYERWNNKEVKYVSVCYAIESSDADENITTYSFILYAADRLLEDGSNNVQSFDICQTVIENALNFLTNSGASDNLWIEDTRTYTPFVQKFADNLAGVYVRTKIKVRNDLNLCNE